MQAQAVRENLGVETQDNLAVEPQKVQEVQTVEARAAPEDQRVEGQSIRENLTIVETQDDLLKRSKRFRRWTLERRMRIYSGTQAVHDVRK